MGDLKTLKNLMTDWFETAKGAKLWFVRVGILKQEAIKEIKLAESSIAKGATQGLFGGGIDFRFTKDVIGYIKWKNNITEEDLE